MDRNRSWRRTEGTQIDLVDLAHRLCRQWKQMAACALVFAVLAGGYSWMAGSSVQEADADDMQAADSGQETEAETETVVKTRQEQEQGVADALYLAQETEGLEEYLDRSILMQIDPNHKNRVVLLYSIADVMGNSIQEITENYMSFLTNGGAVEAATEAGSRWQGIGSSYLAELVTAVSKASDTYQVLGDGTTATVPGMLLYIEVVGNGSKMAGELADDIQRAVLDYSQTVKRVCGSHQLSFISKEAGERADASLLSQQREKHSMLMANRNNLKALLNEFDEEQKKMYEAAIDSSRLSGNDEKTDDANGVANSKMDAGNESIESGADAGGESTESRADDGEEFTGSRADDAAGSTESRTDDAADSTESGADDAISSTENKADDAADSTESSVEHPRKVDLLYVLLGFLGGILAYSVVYIVRYVLQDTVKSGEEFQLYYRIPFFGCIPSGKVSGEGTADMERARFLNRVRLACKKQQITNILLSVEFAADAEVQNYLREFTDCLCKLGIDAVSVKTADQDPSIWDTLADMGAVLLICRTDATTYRMVDSVAEFCEDNHIALIGAAVIRQGL